MYKPVIVAALIATDTSYLTVWLILGGDSGSHGAWREGLSCGMLLRAVWWNSHRDLYRFVKYKIVWNCRMVKYTLHVTLLTPWSKTSYLKLIAAELIKKFPVFYWPRRIITVFTTARPRPSTYSLIHVNTVLPSTSRSFKCSIPVKHSRQRCMLSLSVAPCPHIHIDISVRKFEKNKCETQRSLCFTGGLVPGGGGVLRCWQGHMQSVLWSVTAWLMNTLH